MPICRDRKLPSLPPAPMALSRAHVVGFWEWLREPVELMRVGERCGERKRSRPENMGRGVVGLTRVVGRHYLFVIIDDLCVLVCLCEVCHGVWACGGGPWLVLVLMSVKTPAGDGILFRFVHVFGYWYVLA